MEKYITASCSINKGIVRKNDKVLFKEEGHAVGDFLLSAYKNFTIEYPKFYKMDMLCKLGFLASELLLSASVDVKKYSPSDKGIILYDTAHG